MLNAWLFVLLSLVTAQQQRDLKPDFSGRWLLESASPSPDVAGVLNVSHTLSTSPMNPPTAAYRERLRVESEFEGGRRAEAFYELGGFASGSVGGLPAGERRYTVESHRSVRWIGTTLVIQTGDYSGTSDQQTYTEHGEEWSLDANGRLVIVVTDRATGKDDVMKTLIYRRS